MIFVLELPAAADPRAWFAFDGDDLQRKLAAAGGLPDCEIALWSDEESALMACENDADPRWQGPGWKARWALREQLIATEVLAED
jgi:hypothetical protein